MHAVWTIAKKELNSYFDSLIAYILLVLFLGFSGFFTWLFGVMFFTRVRPVWPHFLAWLTGRFSFLRRH
jgi:ABC-type transport system involved in multi-copper enzyme maturation permease subunit